MLEFGRRLREEVAGYDGEYQQIVREAPATYRLLTGLLEDPDLPSGNRPQVLAAVAYFILPFDAIPEDLHGPRGYLDDVFVACRIASDVGEDAGWDVIRRNWSGKADARAYIEEVLGTSSEFLDEPGIKKAIFDYIGYESSEGRVESTS